MQALVYDRSAGPWATTRGLRRMEVDGPRLDESRCLDDRRAVLVKPILSGFCGSDRGIWFRTAFEGLITQSLYRDHKDVRIMGHELVGTVVEVGRDVPSSFGLQPGVVVTAESHIACECCYQCLHGESHVCAEERILGISHDGCFAELVKLPARNLVHTDLTRIRPEVAAIQEPLGNAVHLCTKVPIQGKRIAILGCGTIGLFAIAVARALGARSVLGVEPFEENAERARRLGASVVFRPAATSHEGGKSDPELVAKVRAHTDGVGPDLVLEMTGLNCNVNNAVRMVRRGGDVLLFGLRSGDALIEHFDQLIVDGIGIHAVVGRRAETWPVTQQLLQAREPNLQEQIWDVVLSRGEGTVIDFDAFDATSFEAAIVAHPKILIRHA